MVAATATADAPPPGPSSKDGRSKSSSSSGTNTPGTTSIQYSYMFDQDKRVTQQCDALLRAIARHIITEIGDRHVKELTPGKLAAFYKAVGGDYDTFFVETDNPAISLAWQKTGCQHTLQPTENDFEPPSIPALTLRGFSRWASVEILLGPEEHVPYIQYAVKHWDLKHPETGEPFPKNLPADVFPAVTDAEVDHWHKACGLALEHEAEVSARAQERTDPKFAYAHRRADSKGSTKGQPGRARFAEQEYSGIPFTYVRPQAAKHGRYPGDHTPTPSSDRLRREDASDERERRRSWSEYPSPPGEYTHYSYPPKADTFPNRPNSSRRHSVPRRHSISSDVSEDGHGGQPPHKAKRRNRDMSPPPPSIRRTAPPPAPMAPPAAGTVPHRSHSHRSELRPDDRRRQDSLPSPRSASLREKLGEKVASMLPNGIVAPDRPRYGSRNNSYNNESVRARRSREFQSSRLNRSHSDLDSNRESDADSSEDERRRRRRTREDREREQRYRDRGRPMRESDRDADEDRDSGGRRDRQHLRRPDVQRRTSSHADIDRQRDLPQWDARDWERFRKERRRVADERSPSPMSRRYPSDGAYERERL